MAVYLNPGHNQYQMTTQSEIYVDKTEMILYLNSLVHTEQRYVSVSRPRRFGKSITANMLCAYYGKGDSSFLFKKRKLADYEGWDRYLNHFDVIRLVMTRFIKRKAAVQDALEMMQRNVIRDICNTYPNIDYLDRTDLIQTMEDVYAVTGKSFVIIIDEWDVLFRERKEDVEGQTLFLDFLRDWLKDQEYVALAYITGILPIQ